MPISWQPWRKETFEKAVKDAQPILLDISASWCHWCQVMEEQTYTDEQVAQLIKDHFVPIRVDTDERPDINERYNQGGWPTTVFLTPLGEIITGTTYATATEMMDLLLQVLSIFERLRLTDGWSLKVPKPVAAASFEEKRIYFIKYKEIFLRKFKETVGENFDPLYGGWSIGGAKFPLPSVLEFCLAQFQKSGDNHFRRILERSLEGMAEHGLCDHLEGGFFRYCVDRQWQQPHFEKMLLDNLELCLLYLRSGQVLGSAAWEEVAFKTWQFIKNWLYDFDSGFFWGSVAAEENYYRLASRSERLVYREQHQRPTVDRTIYTNFNAHAARILFRLSHERNLSWTGELGDQARRVLTQLIDSFKTGDGLFFHFRKEATSYQPDLLTDQISLVAALLEEGSSQSHRQAGLLWDRLGELYYDREDGGFFDRRLTPDQSWGRLSQSVKPLAQNVLAVGIWRQLGHADEAQRLLINLLWQNRQPQLGRAPLANLLLE